MTVDKARIAALLCKEFDINKKMHEHICGCSDLEIIYHFDGEHYSHRLDDNERQALIDVWRDRRLATKEKIEKL